MIPVCDRQEYGDENAASDVDKKTDGMDFSGASIHGGFTGQHNPYALHDNGAADAFLALQTSALGLYAHGIGGFDREKVRAHFNIPADFEVGACWPSGTLKIRILCRSG